MWGRGRTLGGGGSGHFQRGDSPSEESSASDGSGISVCRTRPRSLGSGQAATATWTDAVRNNEVTLVRFLLHSLNPFESLVCRVFGAVIEYEGRLGCPTNNPLRPTT